MIFNSLCITIVIIYTIILITLSYKNKQKIGLNQSTKELQDKYSKLEQKIQDSNELLEIATEKYNQTVQDYSKQLIQRKQELNSNYEELEKEKRKALDAKVANYYQLCKSEADDIQAQFADKMVEAKEQIENLDKLIAGKQADYEGLLEPLKILEKARQDKLFYCIQLTEEDEKDIEYLVEEVVPKVKHPDIISKLIWSEFIKNPLDSTFKRAGITDSPGIYKITNIDTGMCYIGKSTNVKKRLQDHFKSVIGIKSISDQLVHREILKRGINNWTIEQICECEKEELSQKEKFYIETFNSMDYGYNLRAGG